MATLTIRNLDERLKGRLRVRAATRGRSMEEEARQILRTALDESEPASRNLAERIRLRFANWVTCSFRSLPANPSVTFRCPRTSRQERSRCDPEAGATRARRRRVSTLLDTNVLSELLRAAPDPAVVAWVMAQPGESLFVTSVTEAEMRLGVRLLPAGKQRQALEIAVAAMFAEDFAGRIRPFDTPPCPVMSISSRSGALLVVRSRNSTPRSRPSRCAMATSSPLATWATSRVAASRWSIRGDSPLRQQGKG